MLTLAARLLLLHTSCPCPAPPSQPRAVQGLTHATALPLAPLPRWQGAGPDSCDCPAPCPSAQVAARRRSTEAWADYAALMDKLAVLLLGRMREMGLMVAPGQLSASACLTGHGGGARGRQARLAPTPRITYEPPHSGSRCHVEGTAPCHCHALGGV